MTNSNPASGADKSPRILVADDTDVNQKIAKLILQRANYSVDIAADGQEAVEAHRQNPYDLILMDIQMPVMDGHEATQRIREWEEEKKKSECGMRKSETERCELNTDVTRQMTEDREQKIEVESGKMEMGVRNKIRENPDQNSDFASPELAEGRIPTSDFRKVPIIAMTGNATTGDFDEELYPGMNDCIGKPLQMDSLQSVVQKWINNSAPAQAVEKQAETLPKNENNQAKNEKPLDLDRAIEEFMDQKEILLNVLQKFLTSAGSKIDEIRQAVEHADYGTIESHAHAIKGAAANLTADKLAGLAADLEQAANRRQSELSTELTNEMAQEFSALKQYVQQLPMSDKPPADKPNVAPAAGPQIKISG